MHKESNMTQKQSAPQQNQQSDRKSEADIAREQSGQGSDQSSGEHMSRQKAGKDEGAGGGAKQDQKHR
jgi:hypothetical protein